ncbi:MAG: helix-turn-helix domain-containing protein [Candidatus Kryptoniota bacterium]
MESFAEHLKKQREERKIRLSDIAAQTRISIKYLQAIESGQFDVMPEIYIRAFIRDYAKAIGLDPDETINRYNLFMEAQRVKDAEETRASERGPQLHGFSSLSRTQKAIAGAIAVAVLVVLSYLAFSPQKKPQVESATFEKQLQDSEKGYEPASGFVQGQPDSAHLKLSAVDTVWVNLVIDDGKTYDLLMKPGMSLSFYGRKKFNMTVGNAGGLVISLNGRELPSLGERGIVIRNLTIMKDGTIKR